MPFFDTHNPPPAMVGDLSARIEDYFSAGVLRVWVLDARQRRRQERFRSCLFCSLYTEVQV